MDVNDLTIEAATKDSWMALFKDRPDRDWDVTLQQNPEFIDAHRNAVRSQFVSDFDPAKAIRRASKNKYTLDDLPTSGKEFQIQLSEYLKEWYRKRH